MEVSGSLLSSGLRELLKPSSLAIPAKETLIGRPGLLFMRSIMLGI